MRVDWGLTQHPSRRQTSWVEGITENMAMANRPRGRNAPLVAATATPKDRPKLHPDGFRMQLVDAYLDNDLSFTAKGVLITLMNDGDVPSRGTPGRVEYDEALLELQAKGYAIWQGNCWGISEVKI